MTTREERAELREWLTYPGDPEGNAPLTRREARGLLDDIDRLTAERDEARLLMGDWAARAGVAEAERDDLTAAIERVRALHYAADNDVEHTPVCETCHGKAGAHECGCWADEDRVPVCGHCREGHKFVAVVWPCPTIRALDGADQ